MELATFKAVVQDGGGYDNIVGITLANGETIDFVGPAKYRCKETDFLTLGGSTVLKKPMDQRSTKTGDYDVRGYNYVSVDDFQSVIMVEGGVSQLDPRAYRF